MPSKLPFEKQLSFQVIHYQKTEKPDFNLILAQKPTLYPGCVYQFVMKPFDNEKIKQVVQEAIENYEKMVTGQDMHFAYKESQKDLIWE